MSPTWRRSRNGYLIRTRGGGFAALAGALSLAAFAVLALLSLHATPASAATAFGHVGQFGANGAGPGQFNAGTFPQRMAVHDASGKVFVADTGNNRVQVFTPQGSSAVYAFEVPVPRPVGVAVDQDTGDLYVTHPNIAGTNEGQRLEILNAASGTYSLTFEGDATGAGATGDLSGVSGTGDLTRTPTSSFSPSAGSPILTNVTNIESFSVGMRVTGTGIPANAFVIDVDVPAATLTLDKNATGNFGFSLIGGAIENATGGPFTVGQTIAGGGLPAGTTILAVHGSTITPSNIPTAANEDAALTAGSDTVSNVTLDSGTISIGQAISGPGIAPGTTITACAPNCVAPTGLTLSGPPGDTSTGAALSIAIPFDAPAATVQAALRALPSINGANVNVTGVAGNDASRVRNITFVGTLAATDVDEIVVDGTGLNPEASVSITTVTQGAPPLPDQIRKFNPTGDPDDPTGYTPDAGFTSPAVGGNDGELGSLQSGSATSSNSGGIAVAPDGTIAIADVGKNLIQRYQPNGTHIASFDGCAPGPAPSCATRPAFTGLRDITIGGTGEITVSDVDGSLARVDVYNAAGVLQETLSVANNPIPNTMLNNGGPVLAASRFSDEIVISSKTGALFPAEPGLLFQFEGGDFVQSFGAPNGAFSLGLSTILAAAIGGTSPPRLYVSSQHGLGSPAGPRVQIFDAILPALISDVTVEDVEPSSVTFKATVTPQGFETSWYFEYRQVGETMWNSVPDPVGEVAGSDPVEVVYEVEGLQPATEYEVRLVADTFGQVRESETITDFTTDAAAPIVETRTAMLITDRTVTLRGRVNPRNVPTTYRFGYGTESADQALTPERSAGEGATLDTATIALTGLAPGTTYRFKIIAENAAGASEGEIVTFTTLSRPMPDRAFEVVSQTPANGAQIWDAVEAVSDDGNRVLYQILEASNRMPGFDQPFGYFLAVRGERGWQNFGADLPRLIGGFADGHNSISAPASLTNWVVRTTKGVHPDDQNEGTIGEDSPNLTGYDLYQRDEGPGATWVNHPTDVGPPITSGYGGSALIGSPSASAWSSDGSTFVFTSGAKLSDEDPFASGGSLRLYKWSNGKPVLIGVRPDGSVASAAQSSALRLGSVGSNSISPNAVSRDGSRVFWSIAGESYVQIDGRTPTTAPVGPVAVPSGLTFAWADTSLSRVYLTGSGNLVAFDVDTETPHDLTGDIGVLGVAFASDDGRRAYFVAGDVINDAEPSPLGETPTEGGRNLYMVELNEVAGPPRFKFITGLGPANAAGDANIWTGRFDQRAAFGSSDGSVFGFGSIRSVTGDNLAGTRQLFVYDDRDGSLECASCPVDGSAPAGDVNGPVTTSPTKRGAWQTGAGYERWVSSQGSVFFDTETRLLPDDRNSVRDVYEYRRGSLKLISTGRSTAEPATFTGAAKDGSTAFFMTPDSLVPEDSDPSVFKVYAARIGGGFQFNPPRPDCRDDECQGAAVLPPVQTDATTSRLHGPGDPAETRDRPAARFNVAGRRARGALVALRLRVSAPGRVRLAGRGIRTAQRAARRAGGVVIPARLNRAAARRLARTGRVRLRARVVFMPRTGDRAVRPVVLTYNWNSAKSRSARAVRRRGK